MGSSLRFGIMTVFAVSGSMVLLIHQVHKHMLKNFMEKFEFEIRGVNYPHDHKRLDEASKKHQIKKKVRFAEEVLELPMENKSDCINNKSDCINHVARAKQVEDEKVLVVEGVQKWRCGQELEDIMPPNRAVLYRGIMKYRTPNGC